MKEYQIYFTDGCWGFSVVIPASCKQEALNIFTEEYPQMYVEEVEVC